MKYLFVIQGEGRGHLTQAIVLSHMLRKQGHQVVEMLVGKNKNVIVPPYFIEKSGCPVRSFDSPNLINTEKKQAVSLMKSVIENFKKSPLFLASFRFLEQKMDEHKPDVVINFYELIVGLLFEIKKPPIHLVCIAHQYFFLHPHFRFPPARRTETAAFLYYSQLTCRKADQILALSLGSPPRLSSRKITIVPPLMREEVFRLTPQTDDFILGYMVNRTLEQQIIHWHENNPEHKLLFYSDRVQTDAVEIYDFTLSFSKINDLQFLRSLARCKAYASTAGFESICEAMYLGKPTLMVPIHIEQYCNMIDAERAGAGIGATHFDMSQLIHYSATYQPNHPFKNWVENADSIFLKHLT